MEISFSLQKLRNWGCRYSFSSEGEAKFESCGKACRAMLTKVWWKVRLFLLGTFDGIDKITPAKLAETKVGFCQID